MPKERLIDANALFDDLKSSVMAAKEWIEEAKDDETKIRAEQSAFTFMECALRVKEAPTIEAEPVRHGLMIEGRYPNENKCSECGQEFRDDIGFIIQDDDGVFHYPKRCPECGCYWDGGADNG